MRGIKLAAGILALAILAAPSTAAARTYFIGSDSSSSSFYASAFAISKTVYRPAKLFIQVSAGRAPVDGSDDVSCYRGAKHRS
jgi:hypothetical protein